jgi:hypothetical protein
MIKSRFESNFPQVDTEGAEFCDAFNKSFKVYMSRHKTDQIDKISTTNWNVVMKDFARELPTRNLLAHINALEFLYSEMSIRFGPNQTELELTATRKTLLLNPNVTISLITDVNLTNYVVLNMDNFPNLLVINVHKDPKETYYGQLKAMLSDIVTRRVVTDTYSSIPFSIVFAAPRDHQNFAPIIEILNDVFQHHLAESYHRIYHNCYDAKGN